MLVVPPLTERWKALADGDQNTLETKYRQYCGTGGVAPTLFFAPFTVDGWTCEVNFQDMQLIFEDGGVKIGRFDASEP